MIAHSFQEKKKHSVLFSLPKTIHKDQKGGSATQRHNLLYKAIRQEPSTEPMDKSASMWMRAYCILERHCDV